MKTKRDESFVLPVSQLNVDKQITILEKEVRERKEALSCREVWLNNLENRGRINYESVARFARIERGEIEELVLELNDLKRRAGDE